MSKFLKSLDEAGMGGSAPIGFGTASQREVAAPLACLGILREPHPELGVLVGEGVLTGVLVVGDDERPAEGLGDIPVGMWPTSVDSESVARYKVKGCDFLVGSPECIEVAALEDDDLAFFVALPPDLDDRFLRTLEELPVDGVILLGEALKSPVTLQHLMTVGAVRTMFGKHLLVTASPGLSLGELEHLKDLGVVGLAMEMGALTAESLKQFRQEMSSIPHERKTRRRDRGEHIPYLPPSPVQTAAEEDEEY